MKFHQPPGEKKIEIGFPLVLPLTIKAFHHNNDKAFLISENESYSKKFLLKIWDQIMLT